jgi:hypothetical protein
MSQQYNNLFHFLVSSNFGIGIGNVIDFGSANLGTASDGLGAMGMGKLPRLGNSGAGCSFDA